ncbi:hypothetical protein [Campylobacter gastrosuis]|uniref:Glycosyltransferase family 39 protein n=1 Tax=Campylobacter gastrosuis TaxID=2974576 RepID=A0ABT7HQQ1_9BACT|nr:hypothetical protein [Campylobacter gastrosuis]MDL0089262.1 glycosyltransferase family 39 protein [Campylobacter gastrosuis]
MPTKSQNFTKFLTDERVILALICLFDLLFLLYCVSTISLSYYEARQFFEDRNLLGFIVRLSCEFLGQNDYAIRLPMIVFHILSVILLYKISKFYLKFKFDRILAVLLFVFLPGSVVGGLVVSSSGLCLMLTLFVIWLFCNQNFRLFYLFLVLLVFVDEAFLVLYLSLFIFGIYKKDPILSWLCAVLFGVSLYFFGFDTGGRPRGHFADTFGIFAATFSPPIFAFFVYTIYRIWVKESKEILWFVCVVAFCFCMVLSIRQRLELENFLPFCLISTPLMVRVFLNSYRVRLPQFRKKYNILAVFLSAFLVFNWFLIIFNPILYQFISEPKMHFANKFHYAKELAKSLKERDINAVFSDEKLAFVLKFYGILPGGEYILTDGDDIKIEKFGKIIANFGLKKL